MHSECRLAYYSFTDVCVCVCRVCWARTRMYTHARARRVYTLTRVYACVHTHERGARGLGVSQRAPLIRVPASRSHNLRPTSPPARPVGPVARRAAAARVYYARTHAHTQTRARTLTGCTRRQIITRVFFPAPPPRLGRAAAYDFRNLRYDRPRNVYRRRKRLHRRKCGKTERPFTVIVRAS